MPLGGIHVLGEDAVLQGPYCGIAGNPLAQRGPDCCWNEGRKGAALADEMLFAEPESPANVFGGVRRFPTLVTLLTDPCGNVLDVSNDG